MRPCSRRPGLLFLLVGCGGLPAEDDVLFGSKTETIGNGDPAFADCTVDFDPPRAQEQATSV